ncbi:MAG: hypothetical protein H0V70_05810 [Ktedonobacteraceae bacterium]|nr:hypothetical protein [Ktedonobacteraceae bacterium]
MIVLVSFTRVTDLAGRVAPTVIGARVVHRALAGTRGHGGGLRQVAQLVRMGTVTGEVLLLSTASIHGTLPELAQVRVDILVGEIATGAIACRGHSGGVAGPNQPVLLVITEVLGLTAAGAALSGDGGFGGAATEHILLIIRMVGISCKPRMEHPGMRRLIYNLKHLLKKCSVCQIHLHPIRPAACFIEKIGLPH